MLTGTISPRPPVLVGILRLPDVAGTRPMLRRLPLLRHPLPRPAGRVTGLARPRVPAEPLADQPAPPAPSARPAGVTDALVAGEEPARRPRPGGTAAEPPPIWPAGPVFDEPVPPARHAPVIEHPRPRRELLRATGSNVGEPQAPATAFRSVSEFDRMLAQFSEADLGSALGMVGLLGGTSSVAAPPVAPAGQPMAPVERERTLLRRTLGQSRRLGLRGQPSKAPAGDEPFAPVPAGDEATEATEATEAGEAGEVDGADESFVDELGDVPPPPDRPPPARTAAPLWSRPAAQPSHGEPPDPAPPAAGLIPSGTVTPTEPPARAPRAPHPVEPVAARPPAAVGPPNPPAAELLARWLGTSGEDPQAGDPFRAGPAEPAVYPGPVTRALPRPHPTRRPGLGAAIPPPAATPPAGATPPPATHRDRAPTPSEPGEPLGTGAVQPPAQQGLQAGERPAQPPVTVTPGMPPSNVTAAPVVTAARPAGGRPRTDLRHPAGPDQQPPALVSRGPLYRAALASIPLDPLDADRTPPDGGQPVWQESVELAVPQDIASTFRSILGVEVGHIPVYRGRAASRQAHALGARAFTHRAEVFLPDEVGPVDSVETRALLAHELAHAVQQRTLGPDLPTEESAAGQRLEQAALATERWFRGESGPPPELVHRPQPDIATADQVRRLAAELATVAEHVPADATQRAEVVAETPQPPSSSPDTSWSLGSGFTRSQPAPGGDLDTWSPPTGPSAVDVPGPRQPGPIERSIVATPAQPAGVDALTRLQQLDETVTELRERDRAPVPDLDDPRTLDDLAGKLYRFIRGRLRAELIVDRERAGLLADLR